MGKASLIEHKFPKISSTTLWDRCESVTREEEKQVEKSRDAMKHACHSYGFEYENKPYFVSQLSCFKGRYAKNPDPNSSEEFVGNWECCPELTDEEKIGNRQRKQFEKKESDLRAELAKMREEGRKHRIAREKSRQPCESAYMSIRKK